MGKLANLRGKRFGLLTVTTEAPVRRGAGGKFAWTCHCDCGNSVVVFAGNLQRGNTSSCGCRATRNNLRHGLSKSRTYSIWSGMWSRCTNQKYAEFALYGGRGIKVCERWKSFEAFYDDMGEAPDGMSIDRINNEDGYHPSNCRWATSLMQVNNRRSTVLLTALGKTQSVSDWSRETGVLRNTIYQRVHVLGWTHEAAVMNRSHSLTIPAEGAVKHVLEG